MSGKFAVLAHMLHLLRGCTRDRIVVVSNYTQTLDLVAQVGLRSPSVAAACECTGSSAGGVGDACGRCNVRSTPALLPLTARLPSGHLVLPF